MFAEERRKAILDLLSREGRVEVAGLTGHFDVSEDTIRRDLRDLAAQGFLQKTHGGAVALDMPNLGWEARSQLLPAAKASIGKAAVTLVEPGQTLMLDAGLTVLELARQLKVEPLRVITSSLDIAQVLEARPGVTLILTGGEWRRGDRHFAGPQAEKALLSYRADWAFLGTCAVHPTAGLTVREADDAAMKRAMAASALRSVLLADHAKFGHVATHAVMGIDALFALVSDRKVSWLAKTDVRLILAESPEED